MSDDDQDIDASAEERFNILCLTGGIAIARLHQDPGAQFIGALYESLPIALPTFFLESSQ